MGSSRILEHGRVYLMLLRLMGGGGFMGNIRAARETSCGRASRFREVSTPSAEWAEAFQTAGEAPELDEVMVGSPA